MNTFESVGKYTVVEEIGRGAFAVTCKAFDKESQKYVAIKFIDRIAVMQNKMLEYVEREVRFMQYLNHPSFVKVHEIIYDKTFIMVVMDYCENGTIIDCMNRGIIFSRIEKITILYKILEGIEYLHKKNIAHRDIKLENVVFDYNFNPKIIDLGLSHDRPSNCTTYCGTPSYIAPEVVMNNQYDGFKFDIWSFGITAHLFMTNNTPFDFVSEAQFNRDIKHHTIKINNRIGGEFGTIIAKCFEIDPSKRPSVSQLLSMLKPIANSKCSKSVSYVNHNLTLMKLNSNLRSQTHKLIIRPPLVVRRNAISK